MFTCRLGVTSHTIYISTCTECLTHLLGLFHSVLMVRCRKAKYRFISDLCDWSDFPTFFHTTFQDLTLRVTTACPMGRHVRIFYRRCKVHTVVASSVWYSYQISLVWYADSCPRLLCLQRGHHKAEHLALNPEWTTPQCSLEFHLADSVASV